MLKGQRSQAEVTGAGRPPCRRTSPPGPRDVGREPPVMGWRENSVRACCVLAVCA